MLARALVLLALGVVAWLARRRIWPAASGPMPDVGTPPPGAQPIVEPRMQDIGAASFVLPLPEDEGEVGAGQSNSMDESEDRVVVEQHVPADAAAVYRALTDAHELARWWWPHMPDTRYEVDARAGGAYLIQSDEVGIGVRGEFVELAPPRLIRFTWNWLNRGVPVVEEPVTVELEPAGEGTLARVTHELADLPDHAENIRIGWVDVLGRLAALPWQEDAG